MFDQFRGRRFTMSPVAAANPVRTALEITPSAYPTMILAWACKKAVISRPHPTVKHHCATGWKSGNQLRAKMWPGRNTTPELQTLATWIDQIFPKSESAAH